MAMAVVHHNTHCRAKSSGNAIQVRVTTEEMSGERYIALAKWVDGLSDGTSYSYLASSSRIFGVARGWGHLDSATKKDRLAARLDQASAHHSDLPLHPLLQLLMQLTDYPDSPNLLGMSGTGVHCHHGSLWA